VGEQYYHAEASARRRRGGGIHRRSNTNSSDCGREEEETPPPLPPPPPLHLAIHMKGEGRTDGSMIRSGEGVTEGIVEESEAVVTVWEGVVEDAIGVGRGAFGGVAGG